MTTRYIEAKCLIGTEPYMAAWVEIEPDLFYEVKPIRFDANEDLLLPVTAFVSWSRVERASGHGSIGCTMSYLRSAIASGQLESLSIWDVCGTDLAGDNEVADLAHEQIERTAGSDEEPNRFATMGFFESLDCGEMHNGNPQSFDRCRELYRDRGELIEGLNEVVACSKDALKVLRARLGAIDPNWALYRPEESSPLHDYRKLHAAAKLADQI